MNQPSYEATLAYVREKFAGITDYGGVPYWKHCYRVAERLENPTEDERLAALLHDIVEDTSVTLDDLRHLGYSETVITIVHLLTRDRTQELTYLDWIRSIIATGNRSAIRVKLADNQDNADPARISALPPEKKSIVQRYHNSMRLLTAALY